MVESNQKAIFEENQRDLEDALNTLSQYLQTDATYDNFTEANVKVKDKTEYVLRTIQTITNGWINNQFFTFFVFFFQILRSSSTDSTRAYFGGSFQTIVGISRESAVEP